MPGLAAADREPEGRWRTKPVGPTTPTSCAASMLGKALVLPGECASGKCEHLVLGLSILRAADRR
jgi:hypothetical protein